MELPLFAQNIIRDSTVPAAYHSIVNRQNSPVFHPANGALPPKDKNRWKIGFLSTFFYRHSVGRLLGQIIIKLDRLLFDVYVLADNGGAAAAGRTEDDLTRAIRSSLAPRHWVGLPADVRAAASSVRELGLHVLVFGDVFMDPITAHLAMVRMAPQQVAFWGHPFSSGYAAIDYFISSEHMEPSPPITRWMHKLII